MDLEYAIKLLEISLKYDELYQFLTGYPSYKLFAKDVYGGREHNFNLVMKAIYKKYETDPTIVDAFNNGMIQAFRICKHPTYFMKALNVLKHHMSCEKMGVAPFKVDVDLLLKEARNNIIRNKEIRAEKLSDTSYLMDFENYDNDIKENYGKSILWTEEELKDSEV